MRVLGIGYWVLGIRYWVLVTWVPGYLVGWLLRGGARAQVVGIGYWVLGCLAPPRRTLWAVGAERCSALGDTQSHRGHGGDRARHASPLHKKSAVIGAIVALSASIPPPHLRPSAFSSPHPKNHPYLKRQISENRCQSVDLFVSILSYLRPSALICVHLRSPHHRPKVTPTRNSQFLIRNFRAPAPSPPFAVLHSILTLTHGEVQYSQLLGVRSQ